MSLAPEDGTEARALVRLLDRGVVREAGAGRYWIDQGAMQAGSSRTQRVVLAAAAAAALLLAGILLLARARDGGEDPRWRLDPPSTAGVALIHTAPKGAEWEVRCRTASDLMVVTSARVRRADAIDLEADGAVVRLGIDPRDGGAGVFAFGEATPAFLLALEDGARIRVRYGRSQSRRLGEVPAPLGARFVEGCRAQRGAGGGAAG